MHQFLKTFVTISEFFSISAPKRRNYSALLAILSPKLRKETKIDVLVPDEPSPPMTIANKKDWVFT